MCARLCVTERKAECEEEYCVRRRTALRPRPEVTSLLQACISRFLRTGLRRPSEIRSSPLPRAGPDLAHPFTCSRCRPWTRAISHRVARRRVASQELEDPGFLLYAFEHRQNHGVFDRSVKVQEEGVASGSFRLGTDSIFVRLISTSANSRSISKSAPAL